MHPPRQRGARVARRAVHGVLLLDKPLHLSSTQALGRAKWLLRAEKGGHTGTLDPLATGVLPLCFGAATKFSQMHLDADKCYEATLCLGQTTATGDAEGEVLRRRPVPALTPVDLQQLAQRFTGRIAQVPPMYSALKQDGKPLYEYARAGEVRERPAREVSIHDLRLSPGASAEVIHLFVRCSKGTYVRSLAEDIGEAMGCGAHLTALRRVGTGDFSIDQCITLDALEAMPEHERLAQLHGTDILLPQDHAIVLSNEEAGRFLSGLRRRGDWPDQALVAVWGDRPRALLGSAHVKAGELIPTRLLSPLDIEQTLAQVANTID